MSSVEGLGVFLNWLNYRSGRQERADAAVKAVLLATTETRVYIADLRDTGRNRERERLLARLWSDAAVAIRRKDRDFAILLDMKARYWTDPEMWNEYDIARAGIDIDEVAERARALLFGWT